MRDRGGYRRVRGRNGPVIYPEIEDSRGREMKRARARKGEGMVRRVARED